MASTTQRYRDSYSSTAILPDDLENFNKTAKQVMLGHGRGQPITHKQHARLSKALYRDMLGHYPSIDPTLVKTHSQIITAALLAEYDGDQSHMLSIVSELNSLLTEEQHAALENAQKDYHAVRFLAGQIANVASDTGASLQVAAEALCAGQTVGDRMAETTDDTYSIAMTAVGAIDDVLLANGYSKLSGDFPNRDEIHSLLSDPSRGRGLRSVSEDEIAVITEHARRLQ